MIINRILLIIIAIIIIINSYNNYIINREILKGISNINSIATNTNTIIYRDIIPNQLCGHAMLRGLNQYHNLVKLNLKCGVKK